MAINRDFIVDKVTGTGETPAYSWMDPSMKDVSIPLLSYHNLPYDKRVEEAKKLIAEAGYSESKPLEVELRYDTNENHKRLVIAVASMWKKVGVKVKLVNEELKVFLSNRRMKQVTEAFRNFYQMDYYDPYSFTQLYLADSGMNMTGYSDPTYEADYKKASATTDPVERNKEFYALAQKAQDSEALIPIFHSVIKRLVKPYVKGYQHNSLDIVYSKNLSISK
jgi:oligopeptide transport system substrate-binding protein